MRRFRVLLLLLAACSSAPSAPIESVAQTPSWTGPALTPRVAPPAPASLQAPASSVVAPASASIVVASSPAPVGAAPSASPASAPTAAPLAAAPVEAPPKLNVLLVTVDALRADMPWAGYPRDIAPNLTALAKESVVYGRAYSISSYTAMSIGGLLAGRYPAELERSGYFFSAYPDEVTFFPELLQRAGVRTMAAHAHFYFDQKSGFRQGFDDYRIVPGLVEDRNTAREITSPEHLALALDMLREPKNTGGQFFAWFHFLDPHDIYRAHEGIRFGGKARDLYDGEVFFTDRHLGKLFEFVRSQPWGDRTAIVVTADHGEAFGEHRMVRHGFEIWEMLVRVPLIVKVPGAAPRRVDTPRSAIDLAPTILELLGVAAPSDFQGKSLVPEVKAGVTPLPRDVIVDLPRTSDSFRRRALVWDRYKVIAYDDDYRFEVYDLVDDPGEKKDLRRSRPEVYERMKARYLDRVKSIREVCPKMRAKLKGKRKDKPC
ncbi:MAG: sulfatase-like hydrolase/transferase [Deltaproteobacteria bacterium]|nr:sulfatase-like hydrolase/transferase [Deltaproteobacteria bacterium]